MLGEWLGGRGKRGGDRERGCSVSGFFGGRGKRGGDRERGCSVSVWVGEGRGAGTETEVAR